MRWRLEVLVAHHKAVFIDAEQSEVPCLQLIDLSPVDFKVWNLKHSDTLFFDIDDENSMFTSYFRLG